jgi:hypothetical protein
VFALDEAGAAPAASKHNRFRSMKHECPTVTATVEANFLDHANRPGDRRAMTPEAKRQPETITRNPIA